MDVVIRGGTLIAPDGRMAAALRSRTVLLLPLATSDFSRRHGKRSTRAGFSSCQVSLTPTSIFAIPATPKAKIGNQVLPRQPAAGLPRYSTCRVPIRPVDNIANLKIKQAIAGARSHVDYGLYGLLGAHNLSELDIIERAWRRWLQVFHEQFALRQASGAGRRRHA